MVKKLGRFGMGILRNLYEGNLFSAENIVPGDPEYRAITDKIERERQYFGESYWM